MFISYEDMQKGIDNNISKSTIYARVYNYGWDVERAITEQTIPREGRSRKHPKKYTDLALSNGISLGTFYCRLRRGWDYERASTEELKLNKYK